MRVRIEADDVIVEIETNTDTDPIFIGSAAASLSKEASKLFKTAVEEVKATGEKDVSSRSK